MYVVQISNTFVKKSEHSSCVLYESKEQNYQFKPFEKRDEFGNITAEALYAHQVEDGHPYD